MKTLTSILTLLIICCFSMGVSAQSAIDKVIEKIEKNQAATITCTEKRNPETKKPYKMSKVIKIKMCPEIDELSAAIIDESKNAIEYTRIDNRYYAVKYIDGNDRMEYSLSIQGNKSCIIIVEIKNPKNYPKKKQTTIKMNGQNYIIEEDVSTLEDVLGNGFEIDLGTLCDIDKVMPSK